MIASCTRSLRSGTDFCYERYPKLLEFDMHNPREVDDHANLINLDLFEVFDRFDHFLEAALSVTSFQHGFSFLDMPVYATLELLWK